jgi:predicted transcriptional regulator of viral defense system
MIQVMVLLFDLNLLGSDILSSNGREAKKYLEEQIDAKIAARNARKAFTAYKLAPTKEEREKSRREYLELVGIQPDWISPEEIRRTEQ